MMNRVSCSLGAVLSCAGFAASAGGQITASQPGVVEAQTALDLGDTPRFRFPAEGVELNEAPGHPPIETIPAIEMPNTDLIFEKFVNGIEGSPVYYEPGVGERILPAPALRPQADGEVAKGFEPYAGAQDSEPFLPEGMGTMSLINNVESNPWRMNCKLVIEYRDSNPNVNPIYRVCSASMIDAETVLTAGHCVYKHDNDSTGVPYGWASRIWVYPGWDGNGLTLGTPGQIETHGWMQSTGLSSWTTWTIDESFDGDVGLIRTGRAAGMLTGWFSRTFGQSCSTIQGRNYDNAMYPSENCGGSLHNGRDMYYWFGSIDDCPSNQLEINTTAGCFTAMWGGQSGSSLYYRENDNRIIHGVTSNSNRTTRGRYTKLWQAFHDFTTTFINDSRGSSFDLQALRARYIGNTVTAGQSIGGDDYYIANPTNNNPPSRTYSVSHYLSTNNILSSGDTLISTESFTFDFAAVQGTDVNNTGINYTIPIDTPSGTYWMGVIIDANDASSGNDDTSYWDAQQITVNGVADIVANSITGPGQGFLGEPISVTYNYTNQGGDPSNSVTSEVRLSTNNIISTGDRLLGTFFESGLSGTGSRSVNRSVNIPTDLAPGTYYLGVISDSSDDVNASNNEMASVTTITINGRADLAVNAIEAGRDVARQGGPLPTQFSIQNLGLGGSGNYTVQVRASTNTAISTLDTLLGTYSFGNLGAGGVRNSSPTVTIPAGLAPGNYYIGAIVSTGNFENVSNNNTGFDAMQVTVTEPCLADVNNDGLLNGADFNAWLTAFSAGAPVADQNGDGMLNGADFNAWLLNYQLGCDSF